MSYLQYLVFKASLDFAFTLEVVQSAKLMKQNSVSSTSHYEDIGDSIVRLHGLHYPLQRHNLIYCYQ